MTEPSRPSVNAAALPQNEEKDTPASSQPAGAASTARAGTTPERRTANHAEIAQELTSRPYEWGTVSTYPAAYVVAQIARRIREASDTYSVYGPAGSFETRATPVEDGTLLEARYVRGIARALPGLIHGSPDTERGDVVRRPAATPCPHPVQRGLHPMSAPALPHGPSPASMPQRQAARPAMKTTPAAPPHEPVKPAVGDSIEPGRLRRGEHLRSVYSQGIRISRMLPNARHQPTVEQLSYATGLSVDQVCVQLEILRQRGWCRARTVTDGPRAGETALKLTVPALTLEQLRARNDAQPEDGARPAG